MAFTPQHLRLIIYFKLFILAKKLPIPDLSYAVNCQLPGCDLDSLMPICDIAEEGDALCNVRTRHKNR
jgi:hypothetical protein